ncbi:MAG: tetratricopeptide repeat protein [Bacteroidales bacterium]
MIRLFFIFVFTLSLISNSYTQSIPDSLNSKLSGKSPKEQVAYLCKIANNIQKTNSNTAFELAKIANTIAVKNGDINGEYQSAIIAGKAARYAGKSSEGISYLNNAINIVSQTNNKQVLASIYNELGLSYRDAKKYTDACNALNKSISIYEELGDTKNAYLINNNLGAVYVQQGQAKQAIDVFIKAKTLAEKMGDKKEVASAIYQLGVAYANYGNYNEAQKYFNTAKEMAQTLNLSTLIASIDKSIDALQQNLAQKTKSAFELEQEQEREKMVSQLQSQYKEAELAKLKSFEEIEKLSIENQAKEYKLRAIQGEVEKQKLENQLKEQSLKVLEAKKKQQEAEIAKKNQELAYQKKVLLIIGSALAIVVLLLLFIIRLYIINKKTLKLVREQKIQIEKQKNEIETINKELTHQNTIIRESIDYAKHIQFAMLPNQAMIANTLPNFFVFFKPRDVVSGDFYWYHKIGNNIILATIDCTGHGVPGAFMSLIANAMLSKIVKEKQIFDPVLILENLNREVLETMSQSGNDLDNGMDITVCHIDQNIKQMEIAMAGHSCLIIKNNELSELEGKDFSIGGVFANPDSKYEKHLVSLTERANFYFYSDGFADQIGGPDKKKFGQKAFNEMILEANLLDAEHKKDFFEKTLNEWKRELKQVDDIIILGFSC